jgi:molecular chaperone DnaJ
LGGTIKVPTIDDTFDFTVPEGTQSGTVFTFRGKGIRSARNGTGNLILRVIVEIPSKLSKEQKRELEQWDQEIDLKQYDKIRRYSDNVEALYGKKPY